MCHPCLCPWEWDGSPRRLGLQGFPQERARSPTRKTGPGGAGTRLIFTEQAAFLDGYNDLAGREEGTRAALDNLDAELKREPARA